MKNDNLDYNLNDHENNIKKMNKLCLHLQNRHQYNQIKNIFLFKKNVQKKNENQNLLFLD